MPHTFVAQGYGEAGSMTEAEWLACRDPDALLDFLLEEARSLRRPQPDRRKARLFACACCRRAWPALADERSRQAVEVAERYADRLATRQELALAFLRAKAIDPIGNAGQAAAAAAAPRGRLERAAEQAALAVDVRRWAAERAAQAALFRDLFGNPCRPAPVIDPRWRSWNSGAIPELVRAIYRERDFDHLPALADALEAAGCTDPDLLGHCRGPGPHARGCWLLDAVLGGKGRPGAPTRSG